MILVDITAMYCSFNVLLSKFYYSVYILDIITMSTIFCIDYTLNFAIAYLCFSTIFFSVCIFGILSFQV